MRTESPDMVCFPLVLPLIYERVSWCKDLPLNSVLLPHGVFSGEECCSRGGTAIGARY